MGQPYVGEIRMFGGNFNPNGWMLCQGQTLPIAENEVLFQLIGTTYGGDGEETFNLPNLSSRAALHMGTNAGITYQLGEMAGTEQETLTVQQIPAHNHALMASTAAGTLSPTGAVLTQPTGSTQGLRAYNNTAGVNLNATLHPSTIQPAGGSQPHDNMQPYLCINFIISLFGRFPSQT